MKKVAGIRFRPAGKIYSFDSGAFVLKKGAFVIVETEEGLAYGTVAVPPAVCENPPKDMVLKKVHRVVNEKDFRQIEENLENEKRAHVFCLNCIKELGLEMNLFRVESSFDGSKMTFFFTSEGRIDFRELIKMLVKELGLRVEMRQVGIRNQAKMCGGIGRCGREICCSAFIEKFGPVSIRMAKEQGLSLNPAKISGQCGRLMCCLTFEDKIYKTLRKDFPKIGKTVLFKDEKVRIVRHNPVHNRVVIKLKTGREVEVELEDLEIEKGDQ